MLAAADDAVADRPLGHTGADGGDDAGVLVAADRVGRAPALEDEVEVAAADAAVADFDEDLPLAHGGHREVFDVDDTGPPVDGRGHHLGQRRHVVASTRSGRYPGCSVSHSDARRIDASFCLLMNR